MSLFDPDDIRLLRMAVSSARRSFDMVSRSLRPSAKLDDVRAQFLKFENLRFSYDGALNVIESRLSEKALATALFEFSSGLRALLEDSEFLSITEGIRYRQLSSTTRLAIPIPYQSLFERETKISLAEAIHQIAEYMAESLPQRDLFGRAGGMGQLELMLPEQKISPIQFDIRDGRLAVANVTSSPAAISAELVAPAKADLLERGQSLISQLKGSNCDPRLLKEVQHLQDSLAAQDNVIQIGLSALSCGLLHQAFESELPDAVSALLRSHTVGINMYLQQFPDWTQFSRSSEVIALEPHDITKIAASLDLVIQTTASSPTIASPDVPETLRYLRLLIGNPQEAGRKALLAAIRTLENLAIKVFSYSTQLVDKTITKTIDGLSSTAAKIIVVSLLGLGVGAASGLIPVASTVEGLGWVRDAVTIAQQEIATFKLPLP